MQIRPDTRALPVSNTASGYREILWQTDGGVSERQNAALNTFSHGTGWQKVRIRQGRSSVIRSKELCAGAARVLHRTRVHGLLRV